MLEHQITEAVILLIILNIYSRPNSICDTHQLYLEPLESTLRLLFFKHQNHVLSNLNNDMNHFLFQKLFVTDWLSDTVRLMQENRELKERNLMLQKIIKTMGNR